MIERIRFGVGPDNEDLWIHFDALQELAKGLAWKHDELALNTYNRDGKGDVFEPCLSNITQTVHAVTVYLYSERARTGAFAQNLKLR